MSFIKHYFTLTETSTPAVKHPLEFNSHCLVNVVLLFYEKLPLISIRSTNTIPTHIVFTSKYNTITIHPSGYNIFFVILKDS